MTDGAGVGDHGASRSTTAALRIRGEAIAFTAFASGAASMGLEIVASRFLAPYYGTSIYVWGALISVTMVALSLGYYCGGILADRRFHPNLLAFLCFAVAIWLFGIAGLGNSMLAFISQFDLGERVGALFASTVVFLPPEFGIGLLSPLAVRAATSVIETLGRSSGTLSACSAVGGIVGTIVVTFVLVPSCGIRLIVVILAITMLLAGFFASVSRLTIARCVIWISIGAFGVLLAYSVSDASRVEGKELFHVDSPYNSITVVDNGGVRELRFGRYVETAIRNSPPYEGVAGYTDYFNLAWTFRANAAPALFIGAGGGVGPRCFHMISQQAEIDVVEIDQAVIDVARRLFHMPSDQRVHCHAEDGRIFLSHRATSQYHCIVLDAFGTGGRIPAHLATREFFQLCRSKLSDDGVLIMNINSARIGGRAGIFNAIHATLEATFPYVQAYAVNDEVPPEESMNIVLFASREPVTPVSTNNGIDWTAALGLPNVVVDRMLASVIESSEITQGPVLTDDWSPIDLMSF